MSQARHATCITEGVVGPRGSDWVLFTQSPFPGPTGPTNSFRRVAMTWTKPEAEVVAVTMEVTAYVATL